MSWRSLVISNPLQLNVSNNQLIIKQDDEECSIPLEDIGVVVIEEPRVSISAHLLRLFADFNIAVFVCNEHHLPNGIFLSFQQHSRQRMVLEMQIRLPKVLIKRCWQQLVVQKINNQAECLKLSGFEGSEELLAIASGVLSGDSSNREAFAARKYFNYLLGDFSRREESVFNAALNYGYSILRGAIARSISIYGFIPALGIHHRSELNNFNLADDFIEPFRPIVDLWVTQNINKTDMFEKKHRIGLVQLLHCDILIRDEKQTVLNAIDIMIASFSTMCRTGNCQCLVLPKLLKLRHHEYE